MKSDPKKFFCLELFLLERNFFTPAVIQSLTSEKKIQIRFKVGKTDLESLLLLLMFPG